jgi:hypothetical protein
VGSGKMFLAKICVWDDMLSSFLTEKKLKKSEAMIAVKKGKK